MNAGLLPSFTDIRYFLEVSQTGNISRASERLGISQPSLSLAIKRLEDALGTPLLLRTKNGVQLNQAGKNFSIEAKSLLNQWEQIKSQTLSNMDEVSGQYSIGCHPSVALYSLPFILKDLLQNNPELEINLRHDLSRKITEEVISFQVDFAIVVNPINHPDLVIKNLATDKVTLWKSKKMGKSTTPPIIICDPALSQSQSILKKLEKAKIDYKRILTSSSLETIASLTAQNIGIGILPSRVAKLNPAYNLVPYSNQAPFFNDKICLIYRADAQKTKAARAIIDSIQDYFKD